MKEWIRLMAIGFWLLVFGQSAEAAPAFRHPFTISQPDGTLLTLEQRGDEYHHWTETADGIIVMATDQGYRVARIDSQGRLSATDVLAHEAALRDREEQAAVSEQLERHALFHEQGLQAARRALLIDSGHYLPHSGTPHVLTILAAFQDAGFTVNDPVRAFDQYLNGDSQTDLGNHNSLNLSSVRQYFEGSSHGLFSPQFDIVGPVTLPQPLKYYGGSNSRGTDDRFLAFCQDALQEARELVSDWTQYDNDGDGRIELVCVIYAGFGQNQGGSDSTLWAKAAGLDVRLNDQLRISYFNCSPELFTPQYDGYINGTGVFIHEFSHCMGLPDLYATTASAYVNNQGMEAWSIMDYGLYNNNGFAPCPYTAWEQSLMGWTEIEDAGSMMTDGRCQIDNLLPLADGGKAYKLANSDNERDYIVLENIQNRGLNKYSPSHGLLIYHINYPKTSVNMLDSPNNIAGRPAVAVVPAGGELINSQLRGKSYTRAEWQESVRACTFPGTSGTTSVTHGMLPNYCFYDNTTAEPTGTKLYDITENTATGTVSLSLAPDETLGIMAPTLSASHDEEPLYDLQGRRLPPSAAHAPSLRKGLYIVGGKKIMAK